MTIPRPTLLKEKCIIDEPHDLSENGWTVAQYEELSGDSMIIRLPWGQKESFYAYANGSNRDYIAKLCDIYGYDISEHEELEGEYIWVKVKSLSVTGDTLKVVPAMAPEIPDFADQYDAEEIFENGHNDDIDETDVDEDDVSIEEVEKLYDARYYLEETDKYPNYEGWVEGEITGFETDGDELGMRVWTPFGEKWFYFDIHTSDIEKVTDMYDINISEFRTLTGRPIRLMVEDIYLEDGEVGVDSWIMENSGDLSRNNTDETNDRMIDTEWNAATTLYACLMLLLMLFVVLLVLV